MTQPIDFTITDQALEKIASFLEMHESIGRPIRISARRQGVAFKYHMDFALRDDPADDDHVLKYEDIQVWVDHESGDLLAGATLDFITTDDDAGFKFLNPNEDTILTDNPVLARIQTILDEEVNPFVASHGGVISLVDFKEGTAYVQMGGGCQGCGQASATLRQGVEQRIKELVPEVTEVVDTTDHEAGANPYY